jgi:hypothetical protein
MKSEFILKGQEAAKAYASDLRALDAIANRLLATVQGVGDEKTSGKAKLEKLSTVGAQLDKVEASARQARQRYETAIDEIDSEVADRFEALCSYAKHTGQECAGVRYMLNEVKSFRAAGGNLELRRRISDGFADIAMAICDSREGRKANAPDADEQILVQFEAIATPEDRSAFYQENREAIVKGLARRQERAQS